ncbi:MAG: PAS domain S-box protein [Thermoanaerobaculia bacterium]|nr:PAS domain S-box protein [Thermoanaerobaculia bacterium]
MSSPSETASDLPSALRRAAQDPWAHRTLAVAAALTVPFVVPETVIPGTSVPGLHGMRSLVTTWAPGVMILVLLPSYWSLWRSVRDDQERSFWSDLSVVLSFWLVLRMVLPSTRSSEGGGLQYELLQLVIYAIAYATQLVAAERQPHRSNAWRPRGLERAVLLPALAIFIAVMVGYFFVIPAMVAPSEIESSSSSFYLYLFFDVLLTLRFTYLSRIADSLRWRLIYLSYGLACLGFLASHAIEWQLLRSAGTVDGTAPWNAFWIAPFLLLAVPPVLARVRYAPRTAQPRILEPWHGALAGSSRVTLLWALLLPLAHISLHHFELLDPSSRAIRRDLMLLCVVLLGIASLVQQKVLEERSRALWNQRRDVEKTLRSSENDLRLMVERNKTAERLAEEDEKFTRAFRIHHDGLAISLLDTGEIVDANPSFERLTGYSRDELLGQSGESMGFWPEGLDRQAVVEELRERGNLRHVEALLPTRDGIGHEVLASFELLFDRRRHYMMTVLHDVAEARRAERELRRSAAYLDEAEAAILALDADDRVEYWNPAATRLLDLDESDRKRPLSDLTAGFGKQLWTRTIELSDDQTLRPADGTPYRRLVVAVRSSRLPAEGES